MSDTGPVDQIAAETVRTVLEDRLPTDGRVVVVGADRPTVEWLAGTGRSVVWIPPAGGSRSASGGVETVSTRPTHLPLADESVDAACWLGDGPSAYTAQADRTDAIEALARVVPADGPVLVAGLGRLAAFRLALSDAPESVAAAAGRVIDDGVFSRERLGLETQPESDGPIARRLPFYGYRLDGFEAELVNQPLAVRRVLGLDGVTLGADEGLAALTDEQLSAVGRAARTIGGERAVADGAFRLLAVCRKLEDRSIDTEPSLVT